MLVQKNWAKSEPNEPTLLYREVGGEILIPLEQRGMFGALWYVRLKLKGLKVFDKRAFSSDSFESVVGHGQEVAVIRSAFFRGCDITTGLAWEEARRRNHSRMPAEAACLIFEKFTEEDLLSMELDWLVFILNKPVRNYDDDPSFLVMHRHCRTRRIYGRYMCTCSARDSVRWNDRGGFAVAA